MKALRIAIPLLALILASCGIEGEIFGPALDEGHVLLPQPKDTVLHGQASALAGGEVVAYTASGQYVGGAAISEAGEFQIRFGGAVEHRGLILWATRGDQVLLGVVPGLPRQPTVFHEERHVFAWEQHSTLNDLNATSTAVALVALRASQLAGVGLDALSPGAITEGLDQTFDLLTSGDPAVNEFYSLVALLASEAEKSSKGDTIFLASGLPGDELLLSAAWLDGLVLPDGLQGITPASFDAILQAAAETVEIGICYPADRIRVVFRVDLNGTDLNANCSTVEPFKWASNESGKKVFFAGGIHEDTPACTAERTTHCLTEEQIDEAHALLGSWVPNQIAMVDDGTQGDVLAGDGIWAFSVELPFIDVKTSPDGAGVRIGYKYTFGLPGQGWTDSQEWPGNQRILEIADVNGDHVVLRHDLFGDEASNKDKVNSLAPAKGGCGVIAWSAESNPNCVTDALENQVDTDDDCVADAWPNPAPAVALTTPCP